MVFHTHTKNGVLQCIIDSQFFVINPIYACSSLSVIWAITSNNTIPQRIRVCIDICGISHDTYTWKCGAPRLWNSMNQTLIVYVAILIIYLCHFSFYFVLHFVYFLQCSNKSIPCMLEILKSTHTIITVILNIHRHIHRLNQHLLC